MEIYSEAELEGTRKAIEVLAQRFIQTHPRHTRAMDSPGDTCGE